MPKKTFKSIFSMVQDDRRTFVLETIKPWSYLIGVTGLVGQNTAPGKGKRTVVGYRVELGDRDNPGVTHKSMIFNSRNEVLAARKDLLIELINAGYDYVIPNDPTENEWELFDEMQVFKYKARPSVIKKSN